MKYKNILKAQERHEELNEVIPAWRKLQKDIREVRVNADVGYKIVGNCMEKIEDEIKELKKEQAELEI